MYKKTNKSIKKSIKSAVIAMVLILLPTFVQAQCAMCRAVLETEDGGEKAKAVNDGIVYLMAFPYILVGIVGYFIYKSRRKKV